MRISAVTTLCLLLVPFTASAGLITTIYDAGLGTLPELQGFVSQVATADNPHVSGGLLDVDGYTAGDNTASGFYTGQNGTFLFSSFVMESRLRIVAATQRSGPNQGNYPRGGFILGATDNSGYDLELEFSEAGVWLQTSNGVADAPPASSFLNLDTSVLRTYRVEADGTNAHLYLDGSTMASLTMPLNTLQVSGGTHSQVIFGDASILTRAHYQMEHFLYSSNLEATTAPEPGSMTLFGIAAAGIALRRYRARPWPPIACKCGRIMTRAQN
jgi:hypothetical protein